VVNMSTSAAAKSGLRSSPQESPDLGVSSYEEVPENLDAYNEDSIEGNGKTEQDDEAEELGTLQDEAMSETSSLVSEGVYSMNYCDLVDMTMGDMCMVLMKCS
jgi:hypothetical protein